MDNQYKKNQYQEKDVNETVGEDEIYRKSDGVIYNFYKYSKLNIVYYFFLYAGVILIDFYTDKNLILSLWTILYIQLWSYMLHYFSHKGYILNVFGFDLHHIHHNEEISKDNFNIIIEWFVNYVLAGGGVVVFFNIIAIGLFGKYMKYMNHYVVLYWAFIYSTYHMINFHYLSYTTHKNHHKLNGTTDFGPDWVDILFQTKPDNDRIENANSSIINVIVALIIFFFIFNTYFDPVKIMYLLFVSKETMETQDTNLWETLYNWFMNEKNEINVDR